MGTFGHFVTRDGTVDRKEATSSLQVVVFSSLMAYLFACGNYSQEIERVRKKFALYERGLIPSEADETLFAKLGGAHGTH